jgi:uncharacterized membrane protein
MDGIEEDGARPSHAPQFYVAPVPDGPFSKIREVPFHAPFRWLARGWQDFRYCPFQSLFYGVCFALAGLVLGLVFNYAYQYVSALTTGFLLLGPFLALGLYDISRRKEQQACGLLPTLFSWHANLGNIGVFAAVLAVLMMLWARASLVTFALFYTTEMPSLEGFLAQVLALENLEFLVAYVLVGLLFASLVFAVSVVSIPLMLDRNTDAITAMLVSIGCLVRNLPAMILWALIIVALTAAGFATFYLGLVVLMPVIGHATWHAYRDCIAPQEDAGDDAAAA